MRVKCIYNGDNDLYLNIGKVYDIIMEDDEGYVIFNEIGDIQRYFKRRFIKVNKEEEI